MDKTVLITGASRGIGFALTKVFLENDYKVIGTSRSGVIENLTHPNLAVIRLDLADMSSIKSASEILAKDYNRIDILVNNAGIGPDLDFLLPEEETFKRTFEVNVTGTVFLTESLIDKVSIGGKIVNISSKMGSMEMCIRTDSVAYRMSKSALNMYTKILSNRLQGRQKVASVHPGWVRTTLAKSSVNGRLSPEEAADKIFDFIESNFKTGIFWNAETHTEIAW